MFKRYPFAIPIVFIWIGSICTLILIEEWLKLKAPVMTASMELSTSHLILTGVNCMEWFFAALIGIWIYLNKGSIRFFQLLLFSIPILILLFEVFYLIPQFEIKVDLFTDKNQLSRSSVKIYYFICESIKALSLFVFGSSLFAIEHKRKA